MTQRSKEHRIHYKLDQITPVNPYEMNAYNVPFAGNISSCRETYIKGERVLEYTIVGDMSFEQLLVKPIFRDELVEYLFSLSKQLVSIVQNGLQLNKVMFDLKFIYARLCNFSVQIIYLPLDKSFPPQNIGNFMKNFLNKLVYAHTPAIECANQIVDYFDEYETFDVFHFNSFIKAMRASSQLLITQNEYRKTLGYQIGEEHFNNEPVNKAAAVLNANNETATLILSQNTMDSSGQSYITRQSTGEKIIINKQVFCIGKADQGVDYKIIGNKSVSRRHAYITNINGVNYLRDNNSTNHTYLNGKQIQSEIDVVIPDNSIIRIANEEFLFHI